MPSLSRFRSRRAAAAAEAAVPEDNSEAAARPDDETSTEAPDPPAEPGDAAERPAKAEDDAAEQPVEAEKVKDEAAERPAKSGKSEGEAAEGAEAEQPAEDEEPDEDRRVPVWRSKPAALGVATVLLGALAVWFGTRADALRGDESAQNAALTDTARTSEVKGQITDAVNAIFSYNYADPATTDQAARKLLTGRAVQEYRTLLATVRAQAPRQKLVLTTTVTDAGVELLNGNKARLLLFADQRNTRASTKDATVAAAMLAVDAVRKDGRWKIANIDTLGAR